MSVLAVKDRLDPLLERKLLSKLERLKQDYLWISANEKKLRRTYRNKYIAVKNKQVAFDSEDFEALLKAIMVTKQDIDSFAFKHVTKDAPCLLL